MIGIIAWAGSIYARAGGSLGRLLIAVLLFGTAIATVVTASTGALFTDSDSIGANIFSTGTIILDTSPTTALVSFSGMAPGDMATSTLTVSNNGSLQLRYAVTSTTTEATLAAQLDTTIWDEAAEAVVDGVCDTTAPGTVLYGPADLGSTTGLNVIGNPASGAQAGDRTLAASTNDTLCFRVELPLSTGNAFQGLTTTASFGFESEQTKNN